MLKITYLNSAVRVPFQLDGRILLSRPSLEVVHLTLKPGEAIPKHVNDFDVAIYVLSGQGIIEAGQDRVEAMPGMLAEIDGGEERGMNNTSEETFSVLVIKMLNTVNA